MHVYFRRIALFFGFTLIMGSLNAGDWQVEREVDPITDDVSLEFSLTSIGKDRGENNRPFTFTIRTRSNGRDTEVFVTWNSYVSGDQVIVRLDSNEAEYQKWSPLTTNQASLYNNSSGSLLGSDARPFIRALFSTTELVVRYEDRDAIFDVGGLRKAAGPYLESLSGWPLTTSVVTFEGQGADLEIEASTATSLGIDYFPENPVLKGATFLGWNTDKNGFGAFIDQTTPISTNTNIYAVWKYFPRISFYDAVQKSPIVVPLDSEYGYPTYPEDPKLEGYSFEGWYTRENGEGNRLSRSSVFDMDTNIYANWIKGNVVNFFVEGQNESYARVSIGIEGYLQYLPQDPHREGYYFDGWYTGEDGGGTPINYYSEFDKGSTAYAKFVKEAVVTFYDANYKPVAIQTTKSGLLSSFPAPPKQEGSYFDGWYTGRGDEGEIVGYTTTFNEDSSVFTKFVKEAVVTFLDSEGKTVVTQKTQNGRIASFPKAPIQKGYVQGSWLLIKNDDASSVSWKYQFKNDTSLYPSYVSFVLPMVEVPGGSFKVEGNQIKVSGFKIGKTEVTQHQYLTVMDINPSYSKGEAKPVENVTWYDAIIFCNKLSELEGRSPAYKINKSIKDPGNKSNHDKLKWKVTLIPGANGYRLPSEAQWEFAARGGNKSQGFAYSGSNNVGEVAWNGGNSGNKNHEVATKAANELGISDMSGNVWEWCWDWYGFEYGAMAQTDPMGAVSGFSRVRRGGSFEFLQGKAGLDYRYYDFPFNKHFDLGFRVLLP